MDRAESGEKKYWYEIFSISLLSFLSFPFSYDPIMSSPCPGGPFPTFS